MAELVDKEKKNGGNTVISRVYALREKWVPSCLISNTDPVVRECAYLLLCRCMEAPVESDGEPVIDEEKASAVLSSLMGNIQVAMDSTIPPVRDPKKEYHANYDWRLLEFAKAVRYCLMSKKQIAEFGARISSYAELLAKVDGQRKGGDESKWALFDTLMVGVRDNSENLDRLANNSIFVQSLRSWTLDYLEDVDKNVEMYCNLVNMLAHANRKFLLDYVKNSVFNWMVVNIAKRKDKFPKSSSLILSLVSFVLSDPEAADLFIGGFIKLTVSKMDWREILTYVDSVGSIKKTSDELVTKVFWSSEVVTTVVDALRSNLESFIAICKLIALFAHGCPDKLKPSIVKYCIGFNNMFKYAVLINEAQQSNDYPIPEELEAMDSDLDVIIQNLCSDPQKGTLYLFSAFVECSTNGSNPSDSMLVNSNAIHRLIQSMLDRVKSMSDDEKSRYQVLLFGMCIAYVAMCYRKMTGLSQFIADLRSVLPLGPEDPAFNFGAERIANAVMISIDSERYSDEAESLLVACFAKSVHIQLTTDLQYTIDNAMKFIESFTGKKMYCNTTKVVYPCSFSCNCKII